MNAFSTWQHDAQEALEEKLSAMSIPQRITFEPGYLRKVISKVSPEAGNDKMFEDFQAKTMTLIASLPSHDANADSGNQFRKQLSVYKRYIASTFGLVPDGYYFLRYMPLGMTLGLVIGVYFKNFSIGLSLGMVIGVSIGSYFEMRARKAGRTL